MRRATISKIFLAMTVVLFLGGCATDRVAPGEGRSRQLCCGGELWQYQVY
jgi:uncharacterized protein YceK